jgi:hypothetical protein
MCEDQACKAKGWRRERGHGRGGAAGLAGVTVVGGIAMQNSGQKREEDLACKAHGRGRGVVVGWLGAAGGAGFRSDCHANGGHERMGLGGMQGRGKGPIGS